MSDGPNVPLIAAELIRLQNRKWWQWWKPKLNQERLETAIKIALIGEHEPVRIYGVALDEQSPTGGGDRQAP